MKGEANFDGIARAYRWMEYLTVGRLLERTRCEYLGMLRGMGQALVLGDGDGRFTAALLKVNAEVRVEAVDGSAVMLELLRRRCGAERVARVRADVRGYVPALRPEVVVTHFLLDCLTQAEVDALVGRLAAMLPVRGLWVVSEFRIPAGVMRWPARVYVRGLYGAFHVLTGLRVRELPDFAGAMRRAGLRRVAVRRRLFGVLTAEVWRRE